MRLIWPGPVFSQAGWRFQEGLRAGKEAEAGGVTTSESFAKLPLLEEREPSVRGCGSEQGRRPSPFVCQDRSEVSLPTLRCPVPCRSIRDTLLSVWHALFSLTR